jgi:hypothetical protein
MTTYSTRADKGDSDDDSNQMDDIEYEVDHTDGDEHWHHARSCGLRKERPINILTENDIVGYLQERFRREEGNELPWSPTMLMIFKRHPGLSEYIYGTIELLLDLPIQLDIVFDSYQININDPDVIIPFEGRMFVEARKLVRMMLEEDKPLITLDDIRLTARHLFE